MEYYYLLLPVIALMAYVLKAMTGFGPAIVVISLGSLFIAPRPIIAISSILDLIAGIILLGIDWRKTTFSYWLPLAISIVAGTVIGSVFLKIVPPDQFRLMLSVAIVIIGIWFIAGKAGLSKRELLLELPEKCTKFDMGLTFLGGICGGTFGISGPPIIWNFGRQFAKYAFRQVLVPIFLTAAVARVAMYSTMDLVNFDVLKLVIISLPGMFIGLFIGNRIFIKLPELLFRRIVGSVLLVVGIKMLIL